MKYLTLFSGSEKYQRNKCDCRAGYARNHCGACVLEAECDKMNPCKCTNPCQKKHEIFRCLNVCRKRSCNYFHWLAKGLPECTYECDCVEGYRRNTSTGECVPEENCPPEQKFQ